VWTVGKEGIELSGASGEEAQECADADAFFRNGRWRSHTQQATELSLSSGFRPLDSRRTGPQWQMTECLESGNNRQKA